MDTRGIIQGGPPVKVLFAGNGDAYFGMANTSNVAATKWNNVTIANDSWNVQLVNTSDTACTWTITAINEDGVEITQVSNLTAQTLATGASIEVGFTSYNPTIHVAISGTGGNIGTNHPVKVYVKSFSRVASYGANVGQVNPGRYA